MEIKPFCYIGETILLNKNESYATVCTKNQYTYRTPLYLQKDIDNLQSKINSLMLEFCPDKADIYLNIQVPQSNGLQELCPTHNKGA